MGAYSPAPVVTPEIEEQVMETIVRRTAAAMADRGSPFTGVLFAGLMIKDGVATLLEHNVRFGDPECEALMLRLESDLLELLLAASEGKLSEASAPRWSDDASMTVVLAAEGYPGDYKKNTEIRGIKRAEAAGTARPSSAAPRPRLRPRFSTPGRAKVTRATPATTTWCCLPEAASWLSLRARLESRPLRLLPMLPSTRSTGPKGFAGGTSAGVRSESEREIFPLFFRISGFFFHFRIILWCKGKGKKKQF